MIFDSNSVHRLNNFLGELHGIVRSELKQEDDLKSRIAVSQLFFVNSDVGNDA